MQYADRLHGNTLEWEGPTDHFAEQRMLNSDLSGDEIHLFYRKRHRMDFTYYGRIQVLDQMLHVDRPSRFKFKLTEFMT